LKNILWVSILIASLFSQYEYSKEDVNPSSSTYGEMIWQPSYEGYITLHYFTTQGWAGWTSVFGQLSDFQADLHEEGYDKVVIIGVGQSAQQSFNSNFCSNSDLPLVMDQSPDLPIETLFNGGHRDLVVIGSDGVTELYRLALNSTYFPLYEDDLREVIANNYSTSVLGDLNGDDIVNILDIVQLANMVLANDYSESADINSDGLVNILDIVQVTNIILSS